MGVRGSARGGSRSLGRVEVHVEWEERYWYPEDGGIVWLAGYGAVDPESGRYPAREAPELAAALLRVTGVAGAAPHHSHPPTNDAAAPVRAHERLRDPGNWHAAYAIQPARSDRVPPRSVPR